MRRTARKEVQDAHWPDIRNVRLLRNCFGQLLAVAVVDSRRPEADIHGPLRGWSDMPKWMGHESVMPSILSILTIAVTRPHNSPPAVHLKIALVNIPVMKVLTSYSDMAGQSSAKATSLRSAWLDLELALHSSVIAQEATHGAR